MSDRRERERERERRRLQLQLEHLDSTPNMQTSHDASDRDNGDNTIGAACSFET